VGVYAAGFHVHTQKDSASRERDADDDSQREAPTHATARP
jgi:hypothetical protein